MKFRDRIRQSRAVSRENRELDRAYRVAPSQAMRDEITSFQSRRMV